MVRPDPLTLFVNTTSGRTKLVGDDDADTSISYYQVTSAGNSLDPVGWTSFSDQDIDGNGPADGSGNGWEEAGGLREGALAEAYLLGETLIGAEAEIYLGRAYDSSTDARDLLFEYATASGNIFEGVIDYFSPLLGDANNDGEVSLLDLDILGQNYNRAGEWADGDFNGDGQVSLIDLDILGANYRNGTAPLSRSAALTYIGQSVPEPGSLVLMGLGALMLVSRSRFN